MSLTRVGGPAKVQIMNAAPVTAKLLYGSLAPECDNIVRYNWSEFALVIDWAPGHEQAGKSQTRSVLSTMTREQACAEAAQAKSAMVDKMKLATRVKLELVNRTCTIETTFEPFDHEDNDGSPRQVTRVTAGTKWDNGRYERNLANEAWMARRALDKRAD